MTLEAFVNWANGQSLLYPPNTEDYRGQCYQLINYYVNKVWGRAPIWKLYAYQLLAGAREVGGYVVTPNDANNANQLPPVGAIVIFGQSLPGSGGMGHCSIVLQLNGKSSWIGFDSNWGGKTAHRVTHNWNNVTGWIVPYTAPTPATTTSGGDEMIANADQATKMYKLLRPNGVVTQDEINGTAGVRSYAQFVNDAQNEIAQRDANISRQTQTAAEMQATINAQNQTITDLTVKLTDANTSNADKQQALTEALAKIGEQNAQMATNHDVLTDLQKNLTTVGTNIFDAVADMEKKTGFFTKFLAFLMRRGK